MKYLILLFPTILYAPYDADFYIRNKSTNKAFYFRQKKNGMILRLYVRNCIEDTFHVQPERSKREDSQSEMRCSEHYGNIVRKVQEAFPQQHAGVVGVTSGLSD